MVSTKRLLGRPTKLTEDLLEQAWCYVDGGWKECGDLIPSVEGLAIELNVCRRTIYNYSHQEDSEMKVILEVLNAKQKRVLVNGGLSGDMNSNIAKLALAQHGMHDKVDSEITGKDGGPMQVTEIKRTIVSPLKCPDETPS